MSAQDPIGSSVPPERPKNPTHFGGEGLYDADTQRSDGSAMAGDASLRVPLGEQVDSATKDSLQGAQGTSGRSVWEFAKRNHVPALLAAGGIVWLIVTLLRRSSTGASEFESVPKSPPP